MERECLYQLERVWDLYRIRSSIFARKSNRYRIVLVIDDRERPVKGVLGSRLAIRDVNEHKKPFTRPIPTNQSASVYNTAPGVLSCTLFAAIHLTPSGRRLVPPIR